MAKLSIKKLVDCFQQQKSWYRFTFELRGVDDVVIYPDEGIVSTILLDDLAYFRHKYPKLVYYVASDIKGCYVRMYLRKI